MATSGHRVLIVEDDVPMREELGAVLRDLHCEVVGCGDKQTAIQHLGDKAFCMALVDLQIYENPNSIRALEVHGRTLIREIRTKYPERHGIVHRFPILVVSGYAREGPAAMEVMSQGATYIAWKLTHGGLAADLSRTILEQLRASGREDHADCSLTPLELSIPGERVGLKTKVMLGAHCAYLANRHLSVMLHLIKGKLNGVRVHNQDMGFNGVGGNRLPSEINKEMQGTFPANIDAIVENHYHGLYSLIDAVTIGEIGYARLVEIGDSQITSVAREIQRMRSAPDGNS